MTDNKDDDNDDPLPLRGTSGSIDDAPATPGKYVLGYQLNEPVISGTSDYIGHRLAVWKRFIADPSRRTMELQRGVALTLIWVVGPTTGDDLSRAETIAIEHGGRVCGRGTLHRVPLSIRSGAAPGQGMTEEIAFVDLEFGALQPEVISAVNALLAAGFLVHAAKLN